MSYRAWITVDVEDDDAAAAVAGANYKAAGGPGTVVGAVTSHTDHPDTEVGLVIQPDSEQTTMFDVGKTAGVREVDLKENAT